MGGRCSAGFFMTLAYIGNACYVGIASLLVVPLVGWLMLSRMCYYENEYWNNSSGDKTVMPFSKVFNLTNYGIYAQVYTKQHVLLKWNETITKSTTFQLMCNQVHQAGPLFLCAFGGSIFVIFGLVFFIGALSSNYMKLKLTKELTEYKKVLDIQGGYEMDGYAGVGNNGGTMDRHVQNQYNGSW